MLNYYFFPLTISFLGVSKYFEVLTKWVAYWNVKIDLSQVTTYGKIFCLFIPVKLCQGIFFQLLFFFHQPQHCSGCFILFLTYYFLIGNTRRQFNKDGSLSKNQLNIISSWQELGGWIKQTNPILFHPNIEPEESNLTTLTGTSIDGSNWVSVAKIPNQD